MDDQTPDGIVEIYGFPGYGVSSDGRVWSKRVKNRYDWSARSDKWVERKLVRNVGGYLSVMLQRDGKPVPRTVHRLVVEAFISKIPKNMVVDHIDSNKLNNNVSNLQIISQVDNIKKAWSDGLIRAHRGETAYQSKLKNEDVISIRVEYSEGVSQRILANKYYVSKRLIQKIVNRAIWTHID